MSKYQDITALLDGFVEDGLPGYAHARRRFSSAWQERYWKNRYNSCTNQYQEEIAPDIL